MDVSAGMFSGRGRDSLKCAYPFLDRSKSISAVMHGSASSSPPGAYRMDGLSHTRSRTPCGCQLEPTRDLGLKDAGGVVLAGDATEFPQVIRVVTAQRVLRLVGVIQVDERVVFLDAAGVSIDAVNGRLPDLVE